MLCCCKGIFEKLLSLPKSYIMIMISFVPLAAALISQYFYGMHPCELCIYQRVPFVIILTLAIIYFLLGKVNYSQIGKVGCVLTIATIMLLFINSGIAFFHVGVEYKWWVFGECSADFDTSSLEALRAQIMGAPSVRCDDVQFSLFGISMAGWNVLYSLACAALLIFVGRYKCSRDKDNNKNQGSCPF